MYEIDGENKPELTDNRKLCVGYKNWLFSRCTNHTGYCLR